ncbi:MAG: acetoin utilization protein AcuC [Halobacteria archaeon]
MRNKVFVIARGPQLLTYSFPGSHPMNKERIVRFFELLDMNIEQFKDKIRFMEPVLASKDEIALFHYPEYIEYVEKKCRQGIGYLDYGDTPAYPGCFEAASYTVGATLMILKEVLNGEFYSGFNPMGGLHHARRDRAGGFCIFNDAAVAIAYALSKGNCRSVAYVDIDAHHGDGVYYEFEDDPRVIFLDIHQDGRTLYPGTGYEYERGRGKAENTKLNIPLPPGSGDDSFKEAFRKGEQFLLNHEFDIIFFQCGADCLEDDPLTRLEYSPSSHYYAAKKLRELAEKKCDSRIVAMGGGGYNPNNVANAWLNVVKALTE